MSRKNIICVILLAALLAIGILSGNVYSLGHFKDKGGPGGSVDDCNVCHDFANGYYDDYTKGNLRWVRSTIYDKLGNPHTVKFLKFSSGDLPSGDGTLADGDDSKLDGPCEVCHTATNYHTNTGDGKNHYDGNDCTKCHPHFLDDINNYFEPRFAGNQSHYTHFEDPKGPQFGSNTCTTYCHFASDFSRFKDGLPLKTTAVCDPCHSKDGSFGDGVGNLGTCSVTSTRVCNEDLDCPTGETCVANPNSVAYGAKYNWEYGIYEAAIPPAPWPSVLKAGKENWCAGCHDGGTSAVKGISAPNVMGDNAAYGYNVSGHGRNPYSYIACQDCHDLSVLHTDGKARTYKASKKNYRSGYRLNTDMAVPRYLEYGPNAFKLCFKCHIYSDVFGPMSGFRNENTGKQLHEEHLNEVFRGIICWDSDWDGVGCGTGTCADSAMSCTACHNVHGSPMDVNGTYYPCPPMIQHGELTGHVPALEFRWYDANNNRTPYFDESKAGGVLCGPPEDVTVNYVCWGCHTRGLVKYQRKPGGPEMITINNVWTSDLSNNLKIDFNPGESIRYHVSFSVNGSATYYVTAKGTAKSTSGTAWSTPLAAQSQTVAGKKEIIGDGKGDDDGICELGEACVPAQYDWTWDKTIPGSASHGSTARVNINVKMRYVAGGTIISEDAVAEVFNIK